MSKYCVIALYGASGSGKDTILNWVVSNYPKINPIISCTTRPPREGEVDGKDYHFISEEQMTEQIMSGEMLEATEFRGWFYGTQLSALSDQTVNIGVFNPAGLCALQQNPDIDLITVYIHAKDKTRLIRCLNREWDPNCDEIVRRFQTDKKDLEEYHLDFEPTAIINNEMRKIEDFTTDYWENEMFKNATTGAWATIFKHLR